MNGLSRALVVCVLALVACTGGGNGGEGGEAAGGDGQAAPGQPIEAPGAGAVELVAPPTEGAGEVPVFEWRPVDGAASYRLAILDVDGRALWAWEGQATSVTLGGVPGRSAASEGPLLTGPASWSVAALDANGHVIAVSVLRPVAP